MRFAFISEEKVAFPVAILCRVLAVSPSGYYASQGRPASLHARRDQDLSERIASIHHGSRRRYGSPRVHADLKASGDRVGCKRVARLMRENKLVARCRRRFRTTTDSKHSFPIAPNVLERNFTALRPNQSWVTDITFLWTQQGWLYLAVILDLFSRRVVGWATSRNVDRHLALAALAMALRQRRPGSGLVHHSDRGSTYASDDYRKALEAGQHRMQHEPEGRLLGQRRGRELLRVPQARDGRHRRPRKLGGSQHFHWRVHRRFLQPLPPSFGAQLQQPDRIRADTLSEESSVTKPSTKSGQLHGANLRVEEKQRAWSDPGRKDVRSTRRSDQRSSRSALGT